MIANYQIVDELSRIQNNIIKSTIKDRTNIELLQSEEQVRTLYQEYAEKLKKIGNKIFNYTNHVVNAQQLITVDYFNKLFEDIYIDLQSLYQNVYYVDSILALTLDKNKNFFSTLEKRIIELENKLDLARLNVNNITTFDKVYYEGFSNKAISNTYDNVIVDKKTGILALKPIETTNLNKHYNIKSVKSYTFPEDNPEGGVFDVTDELNTFEDSYRLDGTNDMLENGLWKKQMFTKDIPVLQLIINKEFGAPNTTIYETQGIISYVDIEFKYSVDINNIDIDVFGEYETSILSIMYKNTSDSPWLHINKLRKDFVDDNISYIPAFKETSAFNILQFRNIERFSAKFLRIIFNQKNYELMTTPHNNITNTETQIMNDLSERRLELIKLNGNAKDKPAVPKSYDYQGFYNGILDAVDYSSNINEMLSKIIKILEPDVKLIKTDFNKTLKYELGAWSIEPKLVHYNGIGKFKSGDYEYNQKAIVAASIITKQEDLKQTSCNWYINASNNTYLRALIPNDEIIRKENINVVSSEFLQGNNWNNGTMIQLDFPVQPESEGIIVLYEDEKPINITDTNYIFLNSTLLFIDDIKDYKTNNYTIQYIPAKYSINLVYTLQKTDNSDDDLEYNIVAARESILNMYLKLTGNETNYTIRKVKCATADYNMYFGNGKYNLCISDTVDIDTDILNYFYINTINDFSYKFYQDFIDKKMSVVTPTIPLQFERVII